VQDAKLLLEKLKKDMVAPQGHSILAKRMCVKGNAHFLPVDLDLEKPPEKLAEAHTDDEDEGDDDEGDDEKSEEEEEEEEE
jgi:hypothetical protein